jgi:septum formation protein
MKKDFVYLASASPRRSELLRQIGVEFVVRVADIDEREHPGESPEDYVLRLAAAKAGAVAAALRPNERAPVLAADTAVVLDGRRDDARAFVGTHAHGAHGCRSRRRCRGRDATLAQRSAISTDDGRGAGCVLSYW